MLCNKCGSQNPDTARFCENCGNALVTQVVTTQVPVPQVSPVSTMKPATKAPIDIKKFIIVGLLLSIIMMMLIICFIITKKDDVGDKPNEVLSGSRTIMIYMVGSNLETDNAIASADLRGIKPEEIDMENVKVYLYTGGTEKWHNFISSDENAIYELKSDGFSKVKTYEKEDMGDAETLATFLNYVYDASKTDLYNLVFYNHGGAIDGAIYDDFTNNNLSVGEMGDAFEKTPFKGDNKLDTILFRTCLNGTVEVADELDEYARYLIASEEVTNGYPQDSVFTFINELEVSDTGIDYGKKFIAKYEKYMDFIDPFAFSSTPMYSIIDLSKVDTIVDELDTFINGIDVKKNYSDIIKVRSNMYQYGFTVSGFPNFDTVDLYSLIEGIDDYSTVSSDKLLASIKDAVVYNWSKFLKESNGLSVYFPYNGSRLEQNAMILEYNDMDFSNNYVTFVKQISNLKNSNQVSNFTKTDLYDSDTKVEKGEFKLELTPEQAKDFAEASYVVFEKQDNNYYMPVYKSDNAYLDGNTLKSDVTGNMLKIVTKNEEGGYDKFWLQLFENTRTEKKIHKTGAVAFYFGDTNDFSNFKVDALDIYIEYDENGKPYVGNVTTSVKDEETGTVKVEYVKLEDYDYVQFTNFRHDILDENGNFTTEFESDPTKYLIEVDMKEDEFYYENVSLDSGDYYAVFYITDIYGNRVNSNLVSVNK